MEHPASVIVAPFCNIGIQPHRISRAIVFGYDHIGKNLFCVVIIVCMVNASMGVVYDSHVVVIVIPLAVQKRIGQLPFLPVCPYDNSLLEVERESAEQDSHKDKWHDKLVQGDTTAEDSYKLIVGIKVSKGICN